MEKQRLLENKIHGTPRFPIECLLTHAESDHFLVQMHWHKNVEIMQLFSGTAEITIGAETISAKSGDILIINQEELHRIVSQDPTLSYGTVIFSLQTLSFSNGDAAQAYLDPLIRDTMRFPTKVEPPELNRKIGNILERILNVTEQREMGYELTVKVCLLQLTAELIRCDQMIPVPQSPSRKSERLKQILDYIRNNYAMSLTISDMARTFHMSEKYFSRYFRMATGQNFTAFLNTVRIEQACHLLYETDQTVLEISFACGYENVSYFNRVFRNQMGISPLQYRFSIAAGKRC